MTNVAPHVQGLVMIEAPGLGRSTPRLATWIWYSAIPTYEIQTPTI